MHSGKKKCTWEKGLNCLEKGSWGWGGSVSWCLTLKKKGRKKSLFMLTWWATGLLAKIQKPNSLVGLGSEVSAGGSCSRSVHTMQCHVNVPGAGVGMEWEGDPHDGPQVAPSQTERAAGIIRKSGKRKACLSVCRCGRDLHWACVRKSSKGTRLASSGAVPVRRNAGRGATREDMVEMAPLEDV